MNKQIIASCLKIANELDEMGHFDEADKVTGIAEQISLNENDGESRMGWKKRDEIKRLSEEWYRSEFNHKQLTQKLADILGVAPNSRDITNAIGERRTPRENDMPEFLSQEDDDSEYRPDGTPYPVDKSTWDLERRGLGEDGVV